MFKKKFFASKVSRSLQLNEGVISGIHVTIINLIVAIITLIFFGLLILSNFFVNSTFKSLNETMEKFSICQESATILKEKSNEMTEYARVFVVTGDIDYLEKYLNEKNLIKSRENAIADLERLLGVNDLEFKRTVTAFKQSENLVSIELYAMKLKFESGDYDVGFKFSEIKEMELRESDKNLTKEQMSKKAVSVLFDGGYMVYKQRIVKNCAQLIEYITKTIENDMNEKTLDFKSKLRLMTVFQIFFCIAVLSIILINFILVIKPLKSFFHSILLNNKLEEKGSYELKLLAHTYNKIYLLKAAKEKKLKRDVEIDPLTGALNRRTFDSVCSDFVLNGSKTVLLIVNFDDLKDVNDDFGHSAGDKSLQILAKELKNNFRESDFIARLGGDEFAVLIPDFKGDVEDVLKSKIDSINKNLSEMDEKLSLSISAGAAVSEDGFTADLFEKADSALSQTKKNGKKGVSIFYEE